jgi:hypothetical protein
VSKRSLMLSTAAVALLAGSAHATAFDCPTDALCIKEKTTTALSTSTAIPTGGSSAPANIYIYNDSDNGNGSIVISTSSTAVITLDSSNYVYSNGALQNDGVDTAYGIKVDMSKNPDLSASSFPNSNPTITGTTATPNISGAAIYLDSSSSITLSGDGTTKKGIWLDTTSVTSGDTGVLKGDIILASGSSVSVHGDQSWGLYLASAGEVDGNIQLNGNLGVAPSDADSTTNMSMYAFNSIGKIVGDVYVGPGSTILASGQSATAMNISGLGIDGALRILGSVNAWGCSSACSVATSTSKPVIHPEGGYALAVGSSITNGIYVGSTGSVAALGNFPALYIASDLSYGAASQSSPSNLVIGIYQYSDLTRATTGFSTPDNPGFSLYNLGTISGSPQNNANGSAYGNAIAVGIYGSSSSVQAFLTGGIYNASTISATTSSASTETSNAISATAMLISSYVNVGGTGYNGTTGLYAPDYACAASGTCVGPTLDTYSGGGSSLKTYGYNRAGLVNAANIKGTTSGTLSSTAMGLAIGANSNLSSLINAGVISGTAAVDATRIDDVTTLIARGIYDTSGSLTYIYNYGGTISASATKLQNDGQEATAIWLNGSSGTSIISQSTSSAAAAISATYNDGTNITGYGTAVHFGSGDYQVLRVLGTGTQWSSVYGNIEFGLGGTHDVLDVGSYGRIFGQVTAPDGVDIQLARHGVLDLSNTSTVLYATRLNVQGGSSPDAIGYLGIAVSSATQITTTNPTPPGTITVGGTAGGAPGTYGTAWIQTGAELKFNYQTFVPPGPQQFVLIRTPHDGLFIDDFTHYEAQIQQTIGDGGLKSFLFQDASLTYYSSNCAAPTGCGTPAAGQGDSLVLNITPKTKAQLGLTSYASQMFDAANAAIVNDSVLGAAMINGISTNAEAQAAYQSFAPNVTGGTRAIAISITDQATGVIGAHQRALRMYGRQGGDFTLWANEFVQMIKDPGTGAVDPDTGYKANSGFKDHGFGFAFGIDGGSPKYGWYGGALTFYTGDVNELSRYSHANEQWYILSLYSSWRGKGLFLDSKLDAGYGRVDTKRTIILPSYAREADSKHASELLSGGISTGAILSYGALTLTPQLSLDGLMLREEGFTENNPTTTIACNVTSKGVCDAFLLKVKPYYAQSLRVFLGADVRYDLDLWGFYLQPEARAGYRYDFFNDPVKLKAAFAYGDISGTSSQPGAEFILQGPDPSQGNFVLGGSLAATTDTWTLGINFDMVRGSNGAFEQVGTITLLGRM